MKRLLRTEKVGARTEKDWLHYGEDGKKKITTEVTEDASKTFDKVKILSNARQSKDLQYKCSIPGTLLEQTAKISANLWGVSVREAFSEILTCKTDRGKKALKEITDGIDYRKLQAKNYQ